MFDISRAMLGARHYEVFIEAYNDRKRKEKPLECLNGKSPREFMIWISESVIKPQFGNDYFGKRFSDDAVRNGQIYPIICTDGGFPDEVIALIQRGHTVKLCRLHRDGYTFEGDSRNYIHLPVGWHGVNGYEERDYKLTDGVPMKTVLQIESDFLK
ncbi:hypothetical protein GE594_10320 [Salmonella enterica]|nr:hypothetical protein [Salmonella enterica]